MSYTPGHSQLLTLHVEKRATLKAESGLGTRLPELGVNCMEIGGFSLA